MLTLGGHEDNFFIDRDVCFIAEQSGNHQLGTIADRVDSAVFYDDTLITNEQGFQRANDTSQIGFCTKIR